MAEADELTKVEVINKATGEVLEWDITDPLKMAQAYDEMTQFESALKKAKERIKNKALAIMGDQEKLEATRQYEFIIQARNSYEYYLPELRKWFDEDTIDTVLKADTKKTDQLIKDFADSGSFSDDEVKAIKECKQVVGVTNAFKLIKHYR